MLHHLRPALDSEAVNRALRSRGVKFRVAEFVSQPVGLGLVHAAPHDHAARIERQQEGDLESRGGCVRHVLSIRPAEHYVKRLVSFFFCNVFDTPGELAA